MAMISKAGYENVKQTSACNTITHIPEPDLLKIFFHV
jgi:hypothetical protein